MFTKRETKADRALKRRQARDLKSVTKTLSTYVDEIRSQQVEDSKDSGCDESLKSIDANVPNGVALHLSVQEIRGMRGINILQLLADDHSDNFLRKVQKTLSDGVHRNLRDALDLAGKIPFSIKMMSVGVKPAQLMVDIGQVRKVG